MLVRCLLHRRSFRIRFWAPLIAHFDDIIAAIIAPIAAMTATINDAAMVLLLNLSFWLESLIWLIFLSVLVSLCPISVCISDCILDIVDSSCLNKAICVTIPTRVASPCKMAVMGPMPSLRFFISIDSSASSVLMSTNVSTTWLYSWSVGLFLGGGISTSFQI